MSPLATNIREIVAFVLISLKISKNAYDLQN